MKEFALLDSDKERLYSMGYLDKDFPQIQLAANEVDLYFDGKKISIDRCIEIIGRERFLSGIARAAFHWTAARSANDEGTDSVLFDGFAMWKRWLS